MTTADPTPRLLLERLMDSAGSTPFSCLIGSGCPSILPEHAFSVRQRALTGLVDLEHLAKGLQAFHVAVPADGIRSKTVQQQGCQTIMRSRQRALTCTSLCGGLALSNCDDTFSTISSHPRRIGPIQATEHIVAQTENKGRPASTGPNGVKHSQKGGIVRGAHLML
eukprot:2465052-Prymnesium_polylepis.1